MYVLPSSREPTNGNSNISKIEDIMDKVLQKVEPTYAGVKEIRGDFPSMGQLVDSYTTLSKQIEHNWDNSQHL